MPEIKKFQYIDEINPAAKLVDAPYQFSTEKWTRIWFTTKPGTFIPENQMNNMVNFLNDFPSRKITLIYDGRLLDEIGRKALLDTKVEMSAKFGDQMQFLDFSSQEFKAQITKNAENTLYHIIG